MKTNYHSNISLTVTVGLQEGIRLTGLAMVNLRKQPGLQVTYGAFSFQFHFLNAFQELLEIQVSELYENVWY